MTHKVGVVFWILMAILMCCLFMVSCAESDKESGTEDMSSTSVNDLPVVSSFDADWRYSYTGIAAGVHYAVNSTSDGQHVAVTFWDSDGNRLFRRLYYGWREVNITEETEQILSVSRGVGTGLWYTWYFDSSTSFLSAEFECPYTVKAPYVAMACAPQEDGTRRLCVFNVFDRDGYSYFADLDFAETANPSDALREVELLDNTHILVTYLSGTDFETKQVELEVPFLDFENYIPEIS